ARGAAARRPRGWRTARRSRLRCYVRRAGRHKPGSATLGAGVDEEAAVAELPERVRLVEPAVEVAGLLGPGQGLGCRDAAEHLQDPALVDPVLGPGAGEVLHAGHLDPRHVAGGGEPPHPVAVGVPGEVSDDAGAPGDDLDEPL